MKFTLLISLNLLLLNCKPQQVNNLNDPLAFYLGTYTRTEGHVDGKAEGIGYIEINPKNGKVIYQKTIAALVNPSFLTTTRDHNYLYANSQLARANEETGYIYAYKIVANDSLELLGNYPSYAPGPCHIVMDHTENMVFVSNYQGAIVSVYNRKENGSLELNDTLLFEGNSITARQEAPHLHSIQISPDNKNVFIADLGSDKIWNYELNVSTRSVKASKNQPFISMTPGAGPRHLAFRNSEEVFVVCELNNTVVGILKKNGTYDLASSISTLPPNYTEKNTSADIRIHPNGQFLYASNRGHNSIVSFEIDDDLSLRLIGHYPTVGKTPRNFNLSDDGKWLIAANQDSDNLSIYSINGEDGTLTFSAEVKDILTPVCIEF